MITDYWLQVMEASKAVQVHGIVKKKEEDSSGIWMTAIQRKDENGILVDITNPEDDFPPPLF